MSDYDVDPEDGPQDEVAEKVEVTDAMLMQRWKHKYAREKNHTNLLRKKSVALQLVCGTHFA